MTDKVDREIYNAGLRRLQLELIKTQESPRDDGERVVVLLEGQDAAGEDGVIKRITTIRSTNPALCNGCVTNERNAWTRGRRRDSDGASGCMIRTPKRSSVNPLSFSSEHDDYLHYCSQPPMLTDGSSGKVLDGGKCHFPPPPEHPPMSTARVARAWRAG
jgi:hypothetical protein